MKQTIISFVRSLFIILVAVVIALLAIVFVFAATLSDITHLKQFTTQAQPDQVHARVAAA